jgi:hypothetical protein
MSTTSKGCIARAFGGAFLSAHRTTLRAICPPLGAVMCAALMGCGSGAVSAPPTPDPSAGTPLSVSPPNAELFADAPTTFSISGGKPAYSAFSSNNVALPVTASVTGNNFTVVANAVTTDTAVEITVRDAANVSATARAMIKPGALNSQITFQPGASTASGCGANAVCSGGDAQVVVKAAQNGVVLRNRAIRFDVFQGGFQFITPGTNLPVNTLTISTDDQGEAVARIVVAAGAATQVATLQSSDVASGHFRRYNFNIVQQTSGASILSILPSASITLKGEKGRAGLEGDCPTGLGARVDFYVFGGTAPYRIASPLPGVASVTPSIITASGGSFSAQVNGCGKVAFVVTDAADRSVETAAIDAQRGDKGDAATPPTATVLSAVSPSTLSIGCGQSASVSVAGSGTFFTNVVTAGVPTSAFSVTATNTIPGSVTFTRLKNTSGTAIALPSEIVVNIVAGTTIKEVKITTPISCP